VSGSLVLVRHGSTALNRKQAKAGESTERIRGWLNVPLDAEGKAQAKAVAREIASGHCVERVYCSDLERALETGRAVSRACKAPIIEDIALRPWNVGDWAGKPVASVLPQMLLYTERPHSTPPAGEPFATFANRFLHRLHQLLDESRSYGISICVVTHTRNAQLCKAWIAYGCGKDLSYSVKAMNDYAEELDTGELLVLRAA
jgi:broad specificity phosphatase PhoE